MNNSSVKRLVLVPRLNNSGGIANYYAVLRDYLDEKYLYIYRGKSSRFKLFRFIADYVRFYNESRTNGIAEAVLINSSLGFGGFFRDGLYSLFTPEHTKKVIFFRGWNPAYEKKIDNSFLLRFWLEITFLKTDHIIVLSSKFHNKLQDWGYKGTVSIDTTLVDEKLLANFSLDRINRNENEILFLSRIEKDKGIFEAVCAVKSLLDQKRDVLFSIAGNGKAFEELRSYVSTLGTDKITLKGYVKEAEKSDCFSSSTLFLFTSLHEGMPNSVLEAMAFGLPILTTRVGGIPDFFVEGKMGLFLDSIDPDHIAEKIGYLLDRPELIKEMSEYNYYFAKDHFYASKVAVRLERIIDDVVRR